MMIHLAVTTCLVTPFWYSHNRPTNPHNRPTYPQKRPTYPYNSCKNPYEDQHILQSSPVYSQKSSRFCQSSLYCAKEPYVFCKRALNMYMCVRMSVGLSVYLCFCVSVYLCPSMCVSYIYAHTKANTRHAYTHRISLSISLPIFSLIHVHNHEKSCMLHK